MDLELKKTQKRMAEKLCIMTISITAKDPGN